MQTRRAALLTIAGAAASPLMAQHAEHVMAKTAATSPLTYDPVFFKQADYALITRLADLILPRTDTPGAVDAHVPYRIDEAVAASPELQQEFEAGLAPLRAAGFSSLPEAQQTTMLQSMVDSQFFHTIKGLTVDWYYRSEEGLTKELGFHGNTFRADFPGCTHPEHWPETHQETK
jgi:hypothetical protein